MPRSLPATRMDDIAEAARSVFKRRGYRRTQVADVAAAAGLSPAALYRHVESKEALFHLCFLDEMPPADAFVATPGEGETLQLVRRRLRESDAGTTLRRALRSPGTDRAAELTAIITELYGTLQGSKELLALVEASAVDRADLHELFFRRRRGRYTEDLARYLQRGIADGAFRPVAEPLLVATQIREACAWFSWHRHTDQAPPPFDDAAALASIIEVYVSALVLP